MFRIPWSSNTPVQGEESHRTENPLAHLDGLEIKCSVFAALCLKPCPAQYGTVKHCRDSCPSLFSCKSFSHLLMHLPPYLLCSAPLSEQLCQDGRKSTLCAGSLCVQGLSLHSPGKPQHRSPSSGDRAAWHTAAAQCRLCRLLGQPGSAGPRAESEGQTPQSSTERLGPGSGAGRCGAGWLAPSGRAAIVPRPDAAAPGPAEGPPRPLAASQPLPGPAEGAARGCGAQGRYPQSSVGAASGGRPGGARRLRALPRGGRPSAARRRHVVAARPMWPALPGRCGSSPARPSPRPPRPQRSAALSACSSPAPQAAAAAPGPGAMVRAARRGRAGRAVRAAGAARLSRVRLSGAGPARRGPAASGGHFSLILAGCGGKGTRERPRGSCGRRGRVRVRGRVLGPGRAGGAALAAAPPGRASTRRGGEGRWARREGSRTPPGEPPRGAPGSEGRPGAAAGERWGRAGVLARRDGGRGAAPWTKRGEGPAALPPGTKPAAPCEHLPSLPGSLRWQRCLGRCNCWTESKGAADGLSSLARLLTRSGVC